MSKKIRITYILMAMTIVFSGCVKDKDTPASTTNAPTQPAGSFTWTVTGSAPAVSDAFYFIPAYDEIVGTKNGGSSVDIILDTLSVGAHNISPSAGITLEYSDGTNTFTGKSGTVTLSAKTSTLLSGNFNCVLTGGGATSTISGQFSNVPKK